MKVWVRALASGALVVTPAILFANALAVESGDPFDILVLLAVAALAGTVVEAEYSALGRSVSLPIGRSDAADFFAVVVAAGLTRQLAVGADLGPVLASALVGLVAGVTLRSVDSAAYCGSFVGMVGSTVFPSLILVIVAGAVSGVAFVLTRGIFDGFGGKLGTLALFGCLAVALPAGSSYVDAAALPWSHAVLIVPTAAVAAVAAAGLGLRYDLGPVVGSAVVGLVAGLVFPAVFPEVGGTLAAVAFCASFVGMSTPARLGGALRFAVAGALSGAVFVAVSPALAGMGGKLGTTAFATCLACGGGERLLADLSVAEPVRQWAPDWG